MTAFAFIGVAVTGATIVIFGEAIWDPVVLIARIGSAPVIIVGALVVLAAQLTTNMAANVVSPANDFSSLAPRRVSYVMGGLITAVIGIVMMPWKLYADAAAYIFTWLIGYSSLMGAIGGILIADYWVLRKRELSCRICSPQRTLPVSGRGQPARDGRARARGAAGAPRLRARGDDAGRPGARPAFLDTLYTYAWFVTFALSACDLPGVDAGHSCGAGLQPCQAGAGLKACPDFGVTSTARARSSLSSQASVSFTVSPRGSPWLVSLDRPSVCGVRARQ